MDPGDGLCLSLGMDESDPDWAGHVPGTSAPGFGGAQAVEVDVRYLDADTAEVWFAAYTT
jgi:hypothetical protein